jgi:hypothetical protein
LYPDPGFPNHPLENVTVKSLTLQSILGVRFGEFALLWNQDYLPIFSVLTSIFLFLLWRVSETT